MKFFGLFVLFFYTSTGFSGEVQIQHFKGSELEQKSVSISQVLIGDKEDGLGLMFNFDNREYDRTVEVGPIGSDGEIINPQKIHYMRGRDTLDVGFSRYLLGDATRMLIGLSYQWARRGSWESSAMGGFIGLVVVEDSHYAGNGIFFHKDALILLRTGSRAGEAYRSENLEISWKFGFHNQTGMMPFFEMSIRLFTVDYGEGDMRVGLQSNPRSSGLSWKAELRKFSQSYQKSQNGVQVGLGYSW